MISDLSGLPDTSTQKQLLEWCIPDLLTMFKTVLKTVNNISMTF